MKEGSFQTQKAHQRVNDSLVAPLEKALLARIVTALPKGITPDMLTILGFAGSVIIMLGYLLTNLSPDYLWLASLGFVVNWFGDSLDGTLARHRRIERPKFGYYIDHTVDAFSQLLITVGLGLSPYVSLKVALFGLAGYFLVSINTYITIHVRGVFQLSYGKLGPTEARLVAIALNVIMYFQAFPDFRLPIVHLTLYETIFLLLGVVLILMFVVSTIKQAAELAAIEGI